MARTRPTPLATHTDVQTSLFRTAIPKLVAMLPLLGNAAVEALRIDAQLFLAKLTKEIHDRQDAGRWADG